MPTNVTSTTAAPSADAVRHFEAEFSFETDCWDVHDALAAGPADFVLLDVRSAESFAHGHVPGAIHLPHGACASKPSRISRRRFSCAIIRTSRRPDMRCAGTFIRASS